MPEKPTPPPGYLAQLREHLAKSGRTLRSSWSRNSRPKSLPHVSKIHRNQPDSLPVIKRIVTNNNSQEIIEQSQELLLHPQPIRGSEPPKLIEPVIVEPVVSNAVFVLNTTPECVVSQSISIGLVCIEPPTGIAIINESLPNQPQVYRLSDIGSDRRILMEHLGIDIGTKTIVLAFKGDDNKTHFISEINGYWPFERATPFVENILNDPNKIRSDGTKRPARWIKLPDTDKIIVLGSDAEEFAYAKNDTLLRPMADGGISQDEEAMTVLSALIQGMINMAENDVGKFGDNIKICYCTTAPAINKDSNVDYHQRVINLILEGYDTKAKKQINNIKESHAIVLNMSQDGTGIGISWGAGTTTVSFVKQGLELFSFSWIGAGDWIDDQVAKRHGYDPEIFKTRRKMARETPTTVARRKVDIDLTPGHEPEDRVGLDICLHMDILISNVISGIISGFEEHSTQARIDGDIDIYMAGGTSSPKGFVQRVAKKFEEMSPPFTIGEIKRSDKPLFCVAEGLLLAAENF